MIYNNSTAAGEKLDKLKVTLLRIKTMLEPLLAPCEVDIEYIGADISQALRITPKKPTKRLLENIRDIVQGLEIPIYSELTQSTLWLRLPRQYWFRAEEIFSRKDVSESALKLKKFFEDYSSELNEVKKFLAALGYVSGKEYVNISFNATKDAAVVVLSAKEKAVALRKLLAKYVPPNFLLPTTDAKMISVRLDGFENPVKLGV